MTDYFGLVARPDVRLESTQLLRLAGLHHMVFSHLDESQLEYGLTAEQPQVGYQINIDVTEHYWEELRKTHKKFVTYADRSWRQVESQYGALRFTAAASEWHTELDQLLTHKSQQYLRTGQFDLFATSWKRNLVTRLGGVHEQTCTGMLSTLYAGDTWLASHFGLRCMDVLHYWFPVYNTELSKFSPGRLLLKALIEASPGLGIRLIDHGGGDAHYKSESSNRTHIYLRGVWQGASIRAQIARAAASFRWRTARWRTAS
jgi:CelD/BcsL family acetyltransferase involved in cellulose biosynthesis